MQCLPSRFGSRDAGVQIQRVTSFRKSISLPSDIGCKWNEAYEQGDSFFLLRPHSPMYSIFQFISPLLPLLSICMSNCTFRQAVSNLQTLTCGPAAKDAPSCLSLRCLNHPLLLSSHVTQCCFAPFKSSSCVNGEYGRHYQRGTR